jgi:nickel-dependent lactate racemase
MLKQNRREFLSRGAAGLASARLIGTGLAAGSFLPEAVAAIKGKQQSVTISTHEFFGDIEERIDLPASWEVNVMKMAGHDAAPLSQEEMRRRIRNPIGTPPLRELAAGKKRVVVTFDDLERPTPAHEIAPLVLEELKAAGLADDNILFLAALGTHRALPSDEVARKLGKDIAQRYGWINHNCWENLKEIGETSRKNRIKINQNYAAADLRITLNGIKVHQRAGYGGGAKSVLPGVASIETVKYNHETIGGGSRDNALKVFHNEVRLDMEEAARLARVDFSVQVVYNRRRRTCALFAGDINEAHHAACRMANLHYRTPTFKDADIVIANNYPQNIQSEKGLDWVNRSLRDGGTGVLIIQNPHVMTSWNFWNESTGYRNGRPYWDVLEARKPRPNSAVIVYSQYLDQRSLNYPAFPAGAIGARTWEEVVARLRARHKGDARVAVYPYCSIQHVEAGLDETTERTNG